MKISKRPRHGCSLHLSSSLVHFTSSLVHIGLSIFLLIEWRVLLVACSEAAKIAVGIFAGLTTIHTLLASGKAYVILSHLFSERWTKTGLSVISMVSSSLSLMVACAGIILLEVEVTGQTGFCTSPDIGTPRGPSMHPLLTSQIFLILSIVFNTLLFLMSLYIHMKFPQEEEIGSISRDEVDPSAHHQRTPSTLSAASGPWAIPCDSPLPTRSPLTLMRY